MTDFAAMDWFTPMSGGRAPPYPILGRDMFKTTIARGNPPAQTPFPDFACLLAPEAKARIRSIYCDDFRAYRDFL